MTDECTEVTYDSRVKVEENKRKAVFLNPLKKRYSVSKIDDCLIKEGVRADYLVSEVGNASVLVELKGCDVSHACEQLLTSAKHHAVKPLMQNRVGFLVICSKYPRFDTIVSKAKQKCMKEYKAGFHVVCKEREFDIEKVVKISGPF